MPQSDLTDLLWSPDDLPSFASPNSEEERFRAQQLMLILVDWIREYEVWIRETLGIAYRESTLNSWQPNGETVVEARQVAVAWRKLAIDLADDPIRFMPETREPT